MNTTNSGTASKRLSITCAHSGGFHQMSYLAYGDETNDRVLVCVHGLTRNALDFAYLANYLAADYYVVCPDVVGRGASDYLSDANQYIIPQYVNDLTCLLARLTATKQRLINWLGTSMGGLIGMFIAGLPYGSACCPLNKLIINDVGPVIEGQALTRIAAYLGYPFSWDSLEAAEKDLRRHYAPFGNLADSIWLTLTKNSLKINNNGKYVPNYDPAIAVPFKSTDISQENDLWAIYQQINIPILVLRGESSDILSRQVWQEMQQRNPQTQLLEIAATGHAPSLMVAEQVQEISKFLAAQ